MDEKTKARALRRARARIREIRTGHALPTIESRLTTTTDEIPGCVVLSVVGVVTAEVVRVADLADNLAVSLRDNVGGRSGALEELLGTARREGLVELRRAAHRAGGNAIVGVRLDVELPTKSILVVLATGTAVVVESPAGEADAEIAEPEREAAE